ncbi:hypothetical protein MetMK1DRAFT_00000450 [Metallosphaera yellowstonensis MK1]|uniref:Uncharacterized protein n=1 Tax=Metallosphaera yellowstonensis MK1 TaxID=671065 RepID=H2C0H4_9CREN|nr:transposase [Metallosphaera yellowstonensis]EHP71236.1 hypothetical protein MetMK1DRAFT_00000450 [Metallosphaera yellowstonensis MK1]
MVKTKVEEDQVLSALFNFHSILGGKLNIELRKPELHVKGKFKNVIVDWKYVKLSGGKRSSQPWASPLRVGEPSSKSSWLGRRTTGLRVAGQSVEEVRLQLVVADEVEALDAAISSSGLEVRRQQYIVHLKRSATEEERKELDELYLAERSKLRTRCTSTTSSPRRRVRSWFKSNSLVGSFNSLVECHRFGKSHSR